VEKTTEGKLTVYDFGRRLLEAGDLDPVYTLLWEAHKTGDLVGFSRDRWLIAYFCFYHVGTASWITGDSPFDSSYWDRFETAAGSKDYPRSSERRHFRGENARKSVAYLRERGSHLMNDLFSAGPHAADVMAVVKQWVGFGDWIAFKVADMVERLAIRPVTFDVRTVMYDSPRKAAETLWRLEGEPHAGAGDAVGGWAIERVLHHLACPGSGAGAVKRIYRREALEVLPTPSSDYEERLEDWGRRAGFAPPRFERPLGPQEAETILCKFGSYLKGHYHVGEDVAACRKGLLKFARCRLSQTLLRAGKRGGLW
jgi:hypothetical protein